MICLNCKKQIPDNVPNCPNCGAPVVPLVQLGHEIKFRRWQRWFFYGVFILLFVGALVFALIVYAQNTAMLKATTDLKASLSQTQTDLASAQTSLSGKDAQIQQVQSQAAQAQQTLTQTQTMLDQKTTELQTAATARDALLQDYNQFKTVLSAINASTFNTLIQMGVGVTFKDLSRVPVADYNLGVGVDADADGLSDLAEEAFGTNKNNADTDGDGFNDKSEILKGYDPLSKTAKYPIDLKFAVAQKGKILLSVQGNNEAWYVSPKDGLRYFLGRPADAAKALEGIQKISTSVPTITTSSTTR